MLLKWYGLRVFTGVLGPPARLVYSTKPFLMA